MIRKNIYKWHRNLSLTIAIPVLLWALSGFMHPIMTNIRPKVSTQTLATKPIDTSKFKISLSDALQMNHIDSISSFRIVHIADNWFYQVQVQRGKEPLYFATLNGKALTAGNWLYAQYLARQFLEGDNQLKITHAAITENSGHDCCDAATQCVLNAPKGAAVRNVSLINGYNSEYKPINRLLPVYRVSFARADGIRIYVEPATDRFAFAMDNKRRVFDTVFTLLHTWAWLDVLGKAKHLVEFIFVTLAFLNTLTGIYIFFSTKPKKVPGNSSNKMRRVHRYSAIVIALFTLMFSFSGAWHALSKLKNDDRDMYFIRDRFAAGDLKFAIDSIQKIIHQPIANIGIINTDHGPYWRVQTVTANISMDLMKGRIAPQAITYLSHKDLSVWNDGDAMYARYLAGKFSLHSDHEIRSVSLVTKFGAEYNFTDKRLPVWKVQYTGNDNEKIFIETTTNSVAKHTNNRELAQDYSFAFLHKHEFLGRAGKGWKDFSTMFWAMAQVILVVIGLLFYVKLRK